MQVADRLRRGTLTPMRDMKAQSEEESLRWADSTIFFEPDDRGSSSPGSPAARSRGAGGGGAASPGSVRLTCSSGYGCSSPDGRSPAGDGGGLTEIAALRPESMREMEVWSFARATH